jgi:hypothetical protein
MRQRYRLYKRKKGGRYYVHDDVTGKQESLGTSDRATALRLFHSRKEAVTGQLKTGHLRALQNRPLRDADFITVLVLGAKGFLRLNVLPAPAAG